MRDHFFANNMSFTSFSLFLSCKMGFLCDNKLFVHGRSNYYQFCNFVHGENVLKDKMSCNFYRKLCQKLMKQALVLESLLDIYFVEFFNFNLVCFEGLCWVNSTIFTMFA